MNTLAKIDEELISRYSDKIREYRRKIQGVLHAYPNSALIALERSAVDQYISDLCKDIVFYRVAINNHLEGEK